MNEADLGEAYLAGLDAGRAEEAEKAYGEWLRWANTSPSISYERRWAEMGYWLHKRVKLAKEE